MGFFLPGSLHSGIFMISVSNFSLTSDYFSKSFTDNRSSDGSKAMKLKSYSTFRLAPYRSSVRKKHSLSLRSVACFIMTPAKSPVCWRRSHILLKILKSTLGMNKSVKGKASGCIPTLNEVVIFFDQKGLVRKAAEAFFASQQRGRWKTEKGLPIRSWKTVANKWIWMYQLASRPQTIEVKLKLQLPSGYQLRGNG